MNFKISKKEFGKIAIILTIILFLWISTFGLLYYMSQMKLSSASSCLFDGQGTTACTMNFSEHIALWQGLVRSIPATIGFLSFFILLVALEPLKNFWNNFFIRFWDQSIFYWKLYLKQHPQIRLFNFLLEIFSSGILKPRIYEPIAI